MRKLMVICLLTMAVVLTIFTSANAEQQRINFKLSPGQEVQKFINFRFAAPSWGCATYEFEPSFPFFNRKGSWKEIQPGQSTEYGSGFYRFIADDNGCEVDISGDSQRMTGYRDDMGFMVNYQDVSLFLKDSWIPYNIGLLPRNGSDGSYQYSYSWLCPGWGTSVCLAKADQYTDFSGKYVGVIIFNSAGFPKKIFPADSKELLDEWINPGEIALLIHYQGNNWRLEKRNFLVAIKTANQNIK